MVRVKRAPLNFGERALQGADRSKRRKKTQDTERT